MIHPLTNSLSLVATYAKCILDAIGIIPQLKTWCVLLVPSIAIPVMIQGIASHVIPPLITGSSITVDAPQFLAISRLIGQLLLNAL